MKKVPFLGLKTWQINCKIQKEKRDISPKNRLIWVVLAKELNETKGGRPKDLMSLGRADEMLSCNTTTLRRGFAHLVLSSKESIDMYYHSRFFLIELEPSVAARMRSAFIDFPSHFLWSKTSRTCYRSSSRRCSSSIHQLSLHLGLAAYSALQWILYMLVYYIAARLWKNNGGSQNAWHYLHMTISCRTALCMH